MTWQRHKGGPCPVDQNSMVRVRIRADRGSKATEPTPLPAKFWQWHHSGGPGDVVWFEQTGEVAA